MNTHTSGGTSKRAKMALVCGSMLMALLFGEVLCRLVMPRPGFSPAAAGDPPGLWVPDARRDYTYASNFSGRFIRTNFDVRVETSSLGLRGPALRVRPGTEFRLLAVGDSLTFGWGVEWAEAWPAQLEMRLSSAPAIPQSVEVINAGISGYNVKQIGALVKELAPRTSPSLVIFGLYAGGLDRLADPFVLFNGNLVRSGAVANLRPYGNGQLTSQMGRPWASRLDLWLDAHTYLGALIWKRGYEFLRAMRQNTTAVSEEYQQSREANWLRFCRSELDSTGRFLRDRGIPWVVLLMASQERDGSIPPDQHRSAQVIADSCMEQGVACFNTLPLLEQISRGKPVFRFGADGHWNRAAHALVAEQFAEFLAPLLGNRPAQ